MRPNKLGLVMMMGALLGLGGCAAQSVDTGDEGIAKDGDECANDACPGLDGDPDVLYEGWPDNRELDERSTREDVPETFDLVDLQTDVRSQAGRGVCSIFSTTALMEHLYVKALSEASIDWKPDFSEQHLQWSVKFELGSFPTSSGSNARYNLQAISQHGIVGEDDWQYDGQKWSAPTGEGACSGEDAPASCVCEGDDRPAICHTTGHPPWCNETSIDYSSYREERACSAGVADGVPAVYQLPRQGGWNDGYVNTSPDSIKAHMVEEGTGVVVGLDFFYQAWNHGKSNASPHAANRTAGIVLSPNDADIEFSTTDEMSAGHSILLVGWNDNMQVQRVDENGDGIVDEDGNPEYDRGFFLFKNSWGTGSWGSGATYTDADGNEHTAPGYGWISYRYVKNYGRGRVAQVPVIGVDFKLPDGVGPSQPEEPQPVDPEQPLPWGDDDV